MTAIPIHAKRQIKHALTARAGLALVAEGGGQRGVFTAGVLDSWQIARFNPFSILVGTSAGAQNIASYVSGQHGYAYSLITDLTRTTEFFNPWRLFSNKHIMDLDWYFAQAGNSFYAFDAHQASINSEGRTVRFSTSQSDSFKTTLMDPDKVGWLPALKLSSAIPYLYKSKQFLDGGVSAPLPIAEAYQLGGENIVSIRTTRNTPELLTDRVNKLKPLLCGKNRCPKFLKILDKHSTSYQKTDEFMRSPPNEVSILEVAPERELRTKVLGSSKEDIIADYKHGMKVGQKFLQRYGEQLLAQKTSDLSMTG